MGADRAEVNDCFRFALENQGQNSAGYEVETLDVDFPCLPPFDWVTFGNRKPFLEIARVVDEETVRPL